MPTDSGFPVYTGPEGVFRYGGQWSYYTDSFNADRGSGWFGSTDLVFMTHRYYEPGFGKFQTRDPIGYKGGINLYGFVGNNPVTHFDPEGKQDPSAYQYDPAQYLGNMFDNSTLSQWWNIIKNNGMVQALEDTLNLASYVPDPVNPGFDEKVGAGVAEGAEYLYRVIRADEKPAAGLAAKNPAANYSVHAHVANGSRLQTQFISTTKSLDVAMENARIDKLRVVKIDLSKIKNAQIIDLTNPVIAKQLLRHPIPRALAKKSQEVLIKVGLSLIPHRRECRAFSAALSGNLERDHLGLGRVFFLV